jgi:NADH-quinone oxidoreductase subunit N
MWTPDAYQGAPTPVTAFMSAGTKVAAFAAFLRVFTVALGPMAADWRPLLAALAAVSLLAGSILAIAQTNVKRMLAYSSIAHAGFILIGLSAGNTLGRQGAMFYLASYAAMIVGAFAVVMFVSVTGERDLDIADYRGLARRRPVLGASLALFLLSLAGIPPTAGFIGKVTVFSAALQAGDIWLVVLAVLASVVAAFFYLRLVVLIYVQEEEGEPVAATPSGAALGVGVRVRERTGVASLAVAIPALLTVVFGVFPQVLFGLLQSAAVVRF